MTTKQYLRFCPGQIFGVVASSTASIIPVKQNEGPNLRDNFFAVPACENVYIWNLRTKEKNVLAGENSIVTCLVADSRQKIIAVGYADGMVRIFNIKDGECTLSFIGHKTAVSCLTFEDGGSNLASGGKDSEIVVWNVIDEAGLFRLKGHKGPISKCIFYQPRNCLISSSKDTYIKFWDLDTQHCFYTLVGSQHEILDITLIKGTRLITGLNTQRLKVWNIFADDDASTNIPLPKKLKISEQEQNSDVEQDAVEENEESSEFKCKTIDLGDLPNIESKVCAIVVDPTERLMGIHGSTKVLQLFKILKEDEIKKKLRKKRAKEAKRKSVGGEDDSGYDESSLAIQDEFRTLTPIQLSSKVNSFCISVNESEVAKISVLLKNNTITQYELDCKLKQNVAELKKCISIPGHRSFVRTLSCSTDGYVILSASDESVKIWKSLKEEQKCTTTLSCETSLCSAFVPGNKHCVVGTKNGLLNVYDIEKRELVNSIDSHNGFVKCICLSPGQRGITSGGSDKEVKFWDFELVREEKHSESMKKLSLTLRRTLHMPEEVLCLKYSPDGKKLAVALLDSTVQVLFADSLKLAFSLYGHEFPVTCLDISHDNSLIITGSNDRTIRIWSMEFGSCNRRLKIANEKNLPNDKSITCLQFLPKTHLFFSGGKDHLVRQWDADSFQKIVNLKGHQGEITAMTASPDGTFIVTASKDRSIRTWEKTREPLVLEEEQEIEAEEREKETEDLPVVPGEVNKEVALSGIKTPQTIKTVDQLIEALELYKTEMQALEEHQLHLEKSESTPAPPQLHPLFVAYRVTSPIEYMRKVVLKIKSSELEGALLHLPFNYVLDFLKIMAEFADHGWETEFCERCATFLVRIHFGQISTTRNFRSVLEKLQAKLFKQMHTIEEDLEFVKVVTGLHQRTLEAREEVSMFSDLIKKRKNRKRIERPVVAFG